MISPEQTAFLPLRYILDNIVFIQDTLHRAKISRQLSVFLKIDFAKAYVKVSWWFLFLAMSKIIMDEQFMGWVKLLFGSATAAINLYGQPGKKFKIERGVRQGYPLVPYLFLIVREVLTHLIKVAFVIFFTMMPSLAITTFNELCIVFNFWSKAFTFPSSSRFLHCSCGLYAKIFRIRINIEHR